MADSFTAHRGGSARSNTTSRPGGGSAITRAILQRFGFGRPAAIGLEGLSDHLLQDIGLTRADIQALQL